MAIYVHLESGWRVDDVSVNPERQVAPRVTVASVTSSWTLVYDAAAGDAALIAYVLCDGTDAQFAVGDAEPSNTNYAYPVIDGERFGFYIPNGQNLYVRNLP